MLRETFTWVVNLCFFKKVLTFSSLLILSNVFGNRLLLFIFQLSQSDLNHLTLNSKTCLVETMSEIFTCTRSKLDDNMTMLQPEA